MLLTPTFVGLLLAGVAFWTLIWAAIHKLDEIPYLREFTSRQEVLDWIEDHKGLTLVIAEGVNILLHGLSPHGVMFILGGARLWLSIMTILPLEFNPLLINKLQYTPFSQRNRRTYVGALRKDDCKNCLKSVGSWAELSVHLRGKRVRRCGGSKLAEGRAPDRIAQGGFEFRRLVSLVSV